MNSSSKNAFTLLELLVLLVIIGIISLISIPQLFPMIKDFTLKENTSLVEQIIKEARNYAIKKSCTVYADFSQASQNHDEKGGLIEIKTSNGNVMSQYYLDKGVMYNNNSTLENNIVKFNFLGQPVDSSDSPSGFTAGNNTVTVTYYNQSNNPVSSKYITISPITGNVEIQ